MSDITQEPESQDGQVVEEMNIKVVRNAAPVERSTYIVAAESGIFKNGKTYELGSEIELDAKTANNFIELGELENV